MEKQVRKGQTKNVYVRISTFSTPLRVSFASILAGNHLILKIDREFLQVSKMSYKTRRERLKSALYPRLKMRKKLFFKKKLEIFDFFLSENVA